MQVTKEGDYALRAIIYLATVGDRVCSATEVSREQRVPPKFLARIMPKLVKGKIVKSLPGSKGGYQLARPPHRISFLEVLEAIEGPLLINECLGEGPCDCQHESVCSMKPVWDRAQTILADYFTSVTFDQLSELVDCPKTASL